MVSQCQVDHVDKFVYLKGGSYINRTMCVGNDNNPSKYYFDEPCTGKQEVNIYKDGTNLKEIKEKVPSRIKETLSVSCEEALNL
jgi:hypothetical protein